MNANKLIPIRENNNDIALSKDIKYNVLGGSWKFSRSSLL